MLRWGDLPGLETRLWIWWSPLGCWVTGEPAVVSEARAVLPGLLCQLACRAVRPGQGLALQGLGREAEGKRCRVAGNSGPLALMSGLVPAVIPQALPRRVGVSSGPSQGGLLVAAPAVTLVWFYELRRFVCHGWIKLSLREYSKQSGDSEKQH